MISRWQSRSRRRPGQPPRRRCPPLRPSAAPAPGRRRSARRICAATPAVMSVRMMPGRTSNTPMPSAASRSARPSRHIESAGLGDAVVGALRRGHLGADRGDGDDRAAAAGRRVASIALATAWVRNSGAAQVDAETRSKFSGCEVEQIAAHRRADAGIVDEAVDPAEARERRRRQGGGVAVEIARRRCA